MITCLASLPKGAPSLYDPSFLDTINHPRFYSSGVNARLVSSYVVRSSSGVATFPHVKCDEFVDCACCCHQAPSLMSTGHVYDTQALVTVQGLRFNFVHTIDFICSIGQGHSHFQTGLNPSFQWGCCSTSRSAT
jgi:hypothetical protein